MPVSNFLIALSVVTITIGATCTGSTCSINVPADQYVKVGDTVQFVSANPTDFFLVYFKDKEPIIFKNRTAQVFYGTSDGDEVTALPGETKSARYSIFWTNKANTATADPKVTVGPGTKPPVENAK